MFKLIASGLIVSGLIWGISKLRDKALDYADDIDWEGQ